MGQTVDSIYTFRILCQGFKIHERHSFLTQLLGVTKLEEDLSYTNITNLVTVVTVCMVLFSLGEVAMYFLYNFKVSLYKRF